MTTGFGHSASGPCCAAGVGHNQARISLPPMEESGRGVVQLAAKQDYRLDTRHSSTHSTVKAAERVRDSYRTRSR
eukprot:scaffold8528_cov36-Prasinocladus_malaysianus.AAC.1